MLYVKRLHDSVLSSPASVPALLELLCKEQLGSGLNASAPVSNVSAPAHTNGVRLHLRLVSAAQRNRSLAMLSFTVQSIDLPMEGGRF